MSAPFHSHRSGSRPEQSAVFVYKHKMWRESLKAVDNLQRLTFHNCISKNVFYFCDIHKAKCILYAPKNFTSGRVFDPFETSTKICR